MYKNDSLKLSKSTRFDAFDKKLPIGYASGCIRHMAQPLNRVMHATTPQFGFVLTNPDYEYAVRECLYYWKLMLVHSILVNVYGEDPEIFYDKDFSEAELDDLLMRFYPSNNKWIISEDGRGYVNGQLRAPRTLHPLFDKTKSMDPEMRQSFFRIDPDTGKWLFFADK